MGNLNSNELTNTELALLNNILYTNEITDFENITLKDYINKLRDKGVENLDDPNYDFDLTAKE